MNLFGAGYLFGRAAATTANPNPTPRRFGTLQEISFDQSYTVKELYGAGSIAIREFRGPSKVTMKAKFAQINGYVFAELFWGVTPAVGSTITVADEVQTVPAITTYTLTASKAGTSGANFLEDLGVAYGATGTPLKLVIIAPTQGQYSVTSLGVYTFAAADAGTAMVLNYRYSNTTAGITLSIPNTMQGESPYFECVLGNSQDGGFERRVYKCAASKIAENFKQGDIMIPELDLAVYDPGTGVVWTDSYAAQ